MTCKFKFFNPAILSGMIYYEFKNYSLDTADINIVSKATNLAIAQVTIMNILFSIYN